LRFGKRVFDAVAEGAIFKRIQSEMDTANMRSPGKAEPVFHLVANAVFRGRDKRIGPDHRIGVGPAG